MHTFTAVSQTPAATRTHAEAALERLARTVTTLSTELDDLPLAHQALLDALKAEDKPLIEHEMNHLLQRLEDYWLAPSALGQSRRKLFTARLNKALHDEAILKSHETDLGMDAAACLPLSAPAMGEPSQTRAGAASLHVKLNHQTFVEIKGALVMSTDAGRTLLALPACGLTEFASQGELFETLAQWLNDAELRWALLINADQRHQDAAVAIAEDPELFMEAFGPADVQLQSITDDPYRHALQRQMDKQREDLRYACGVGLGTDPQQHAGQIEAAIRMSGLFGPEAMLERREQALAEHALRKGLPDWIKIASADDLDTYGQHLARHDQARQALSSVLNGAASADQYAQVSVRTRLANDLGYDLEPDDITVTTQRTLPVTGQSYTIARTLTQLALYGLHPGDRQDGSEFLTRSTIDIDGIPQGPAHALLTPAYIARIIEGLDLRLGFADYQRTAYAKGANQKSMRELIHIQLAEAAYAAKLQGHLSPEEFAIVEAIATSAPAENGAVMRTQHIRINNSGILGRILLLRKDNAQGELERLIMFAADAPREQLFQSFLNETQLLHELVAWAADPQMSEYLLGQSSAAERPMLDEALQALRQKPHPLPDFIRLISLDSYDAGLRNFVRELIDVSLSRHQAHTPDWYRQASAAQRQELLQLEDASAAAIRHYEAQAHTRVQDFEDYVHQRASEKICQLLNVPPGTVDPDQIVITSERETMTYTRMMRDGYDDSIGLFTAAADGMASFSGPQGVDLSALTAVNVARSVHGKWLADDYTAGIRRNQLDPASTGYEYRRQASTLITLLHMQSAALRSLLKGHIDAAQYHWLKVAISNLHDSHADTRARYPVYPLQIHINKPLIGSGLRGLDDLVMTSTHLTHVETVQGCFALLYTDNRLAPLLYTPQAPDGVEFRVFSSFAESLSAPGMIDYYKDRCRINARRVLSFFLNDMKQGTANKPPVIPRESITDFAHICFNRPIERKLRDVEETTSGRHDMLSKVIWNSIDIIATVLTLPFPPASFVVGVGLSLRDSVKAYQALIGHSPEQAGALILAAALNMAGAAGDLQVGLKGFGGVLRKLARDSKTGVSPKVLNKTPAATTRQTLYPVQLENEPFLLGKPNANGQAAVYRSLGFDTDEVYATRHYAVRDASGSWQPLGQPSSPALAGARQVVSANRVVNISLRDLPRLSEGHAAGVSLGNGKCFIEMHGLVYQVNYDASVRCWHIVDPDNPFAFFGRQPVRLDDQGQWKLIERAGLRGGGKDDPTGFNPLPEDAGASAPAPASLRDFEVPKNFQRHLDRVLNTAPMEELGVGLDEFFEIYYAQMRQVYFMLKEKLYRHARAFFDQPLALPPRPLIPAVDASTPVGSFLESVFANSNGLVLSEAPKSIASKRFLVTHMHNLVEQRVEVIYLPHLFTDKHLGKLAKYRVKGKSVRSGSHEIKNHLELINGGALNNLSREYDYYHLIKQAHRHGIEVRPLSSSVSYPVDGFAVATSVADSTAAQKMSNFFAHKLIASDVAQDPSKRWIALLDRTFATTHEQVPGIAQLEGAISIHIEDVAAGQATRISADAGRVGIDAQSTPCDFTLAFANPNKTDAAAVAGVPARLDTASSAGAGAVTASPDAARAALRWDDATGWKRVTTQQSSVDSSPTALQQSLSDAAYEVPADSRRILHELAYDRIRGLDSRYFTLDDDIIPVQTRFFELRSKLQVDSRPIVFGEVPLRPVMPVLEPQPSAAQFIQSLYQNTDGMVVGEFHASIGSKKFIIDNLPLLAQQKVKTLYMEHLLTDLHQADLDRFFDTGIMSQRLLDDLRTMDSGHLTDPDNVYNFEKLVIRAQQHGMEIRAIDCAASYHLKGVRPETPTIRQQMMNYFASRTIRRHQAVMGKHRWVALVGNSHANTYRTVPGIAELEGAIGVHLDDVAPGTSRGITLDPGESRRTPLGKQSGFVKGDFRVEIEVPGTLIDLTPPATPSVEGRLTFPGMFVIEREAGSAQVIIHRSRDSAIHRTPVQINAQGKVFVDRPNWTQVHLHPFDSPEALALALERMHLHRVG